MKRQYVLEGWSEFRSKAVPRDASTEQVHQLRLAFYAGASVLFGSIMNMLDPGAEATDADLTKMDDLHQELQRFEEEQKQSRGRKAEIFFPH